MRHSAKLAAGFFVGVGMAASAISNAGDVQSARAVIRGAQGSGISGLVLLMQVAGDQFTPVSEVVVDVRVQGLTPGRHGMHIHAVGSCANSFAAAGGHFDPGPKGHSAPVDENHPFHSGDLPNIEVNEQGIGYLRYTTSRITLSSGPLSVFDADGSAVIIHQNEDLGATGVIGASGGPRVACGVIEPD